MWGRGENEATMQMGRSPNWNYAFKIVMPWGVLLGHVGEIEGDRQGEEDRGRGPLRGADLKHLSTAETQDTCAGCNIGIYSRVLVSRSGHRVFQSSWFWSFQIGVFPK